MKLVQAILFIAVAGALSGAHAAMSTGDAKKVVPEAPKGANCKDQSEGAFTDPPRAATAGTIDSIYGTKPGSGLGAPRAGA